MITGSGRGGLVLQRESKILGWDLVLWDFVCRCLGILKAEPYQYSASFRDAVQAPELAPRNCFF